MSKMRADSAREVKLCIIGKEGVGKTNLTLRFIKDEFKKHHETTIAASCMMKRMMFNGTELKYTIWDTAGQERYKSLVKLYYRAAEAVIIVYDITEELSFTAVKHWVKELEREGPENVVIVIAGNKLDLEKEREIPEKRGEQYANSIEALFFEVSAKTSKNVDLMFRELSKKLLSEQKSPTKSNCVQLQDNAKKSNCC